MGQTNTLDILLKEIKDPHAQENWYRLKLFLERLTTTDGVTTIIPGGGGTSTDPVWEKFTRVVPGSSTIVADTLLLTAFNQLEHIINFKETVTKVEKGLKMTIVKTDTTLKDSVYAVTGAPMSMEVNAVINGSSYELQIVNNGANAVDMSFARLTLP